MADGIQFSVCEGRFCLAKLPVDTDLSTIRHPQGFCSLTRTDEEISVIADESFAHPSAEIQRGWRAIKVKGPLEFELKGVLASMLNPLNEADIAVLTLSTYNTDYIFVLDYRLDQAVRVLGGVGFVEV